MLTMNNIEVNNGTITFNDIDTIEKGTTVFISTGKTDLYMESNTNTSISNWIDLIVATYNVIEDKDTTAIKADSSIVFDNINDIEMDVGSTI